MPDSNRRPAASRAVALPSELTSTSRNTLAQASAYARGKTPRTGWALEPIPLKPADLMLRIAGCFQSAIRLGTPARMLFLFPSCSHRSTQVQRTCACRSRALCHGANAHRVLQGGRNLPGTGFVICFRMTIAMRTTKTKRPRVWRPEGVRVASGDRGDRSPRADSVKVCEGYAAFRAGKAAQRYLRATANRFLRSAAA